MVHGLNLVIAVDSGPQAPVFPPSTITNQTETPATSLAAPPAGPTPGRPT